MRTLKELEEKYDLEFRRIISEINKKKCRLVLLQFPDGLKLYATAIVDYLESKTRAEFLIWLGDCFGACDTPILGRELEKKIDLVVQFGHNEMMPEY